MERTDQYRSRLYDSTTNIDDVRRPLLVALAAFAQILDMLTTHLGLLSGHAEANPFFAPADETRLMVGKALIAAAVLCTMWVMRRRLPVGVLRLVVLVSLAGPVLNLRALS
jgi:hypothetical protein